MNIRSQYKTKQRQLIIDFLKESGEAHLTAGDLCRHFKDNGIAVGQSTIYRQLEKLVDEGIISKHAVAPNSPACFEYIGKDSHVDGEVCYHCKCEKCGKLIHLHCDEMEEIRNHMLKAHSFEIDSKRTVFYGLCEDCKH